MEQMNQKGTIIPVKDVIPKLGKIVPLNWCTNCSNILFFFRRGFDSPWGGWCGLQKNWR